MTVGISISFGMLDIVNIAHPAFIILGSYLAYIINQSYGLDPVLVGLLMLRSRTGAGGGQITLTRANAPRLAIAGGATGALAGFFGVGGGFLIVPALVGSAGMSMTCAVGSSLVAVAAFSATTAVNYALSGWVDWPLAACFLGGSALGGLAGVRIGAQLADRRDALRWLFVALLFAVAAYILYRALAS